MTAMLLTEERAGLRDVVRRCLERSAGPRPYLSGEAGGRGPHDAELWRLLADEVGVPGLIVAEESGGAGATFADLAVVAGELGRTLAPVPFFSTVALATTALLVQDGEGPAAELLARIARGATATLAWCEDDGSWDLSSPATAAHQDGDRWTLTGRKLLVVDAVTADLLLVAARTEEGPGLFAVEREAAGLVREAASTLDLTRALGTVAFDAAQARPVGLGPGVARRLGTALDLAIVLLAAEQVEAAQARLDDAVAYAKQRVQFGRPIGGFQAIKHTLVDVLLKVEMARSAGHAAADAADDYLADPGERTAHRLAAAASVAKAMCSEAFMHAAEETLHVCGGIGFTWEHDAHLYYRRAKSTELFLGTPDQHRDRLAGHAGLRAGRR
ncbi:acyl-CoA dehydrogenase [Actinomadura sp. LD22]|uniref:Acyl-CoA dehydrogenase n=1 Tax=Actinomadura physcomitrii TaxID=2650748 RepID=A0A6I4MBX6_9ACTN|nr:acyl-CoA dehydrogenase family protein [Actinomadura physcomitrii]MWA03203.1 acyl-CoA dehydrogenase [Actinomadura physcomitrii]